MRKAGQSKAGREIYGRENAVLAVVSRKALHEDVASEQS